MIRVTLAYWKYNNRDFRLDKNSEYMTQIFVADNCKDAMEKINSFKFFHDCAKYTHAEIVNLEDVKI